MKIVFIDELFVLNLLINYLILLATARFSGMPYKQLRLALSAFCGGAYAVAVYLLPQTAFAWLPVKIAMGLVMVLLAFGRGTRNDFVKRTLIFYIVSLLFGGAVVLVNIIFGDQLISTQNGTLYAPQNGKLLIAATAIACAAVSFLFGGAGRAARGGTVRVEVTHRGHNTEFTALLDSGNLLRDPLSGAPVVIAELGALEGLLDPGTRSLLSSEGDAASVLELLATLDPTARWRLLPYRSLGNGNGLLVAFRPDRVSFGDRLVEGVLVAVSPQSLGAAAGWCALVGAD